MSEEKPVDSTDTQPKPRWSLLRFLDSAHPSFLEAFKKTEPLSSLAALSIIIAAFSSNLPQARQDAVVSGAMFLLAFVFSTLVVLGAKRFMLELFVFVLTGLGIVFLGGVVLEYGIASKVLGNTLSLAGDLVLGVLQITLLPAFVNDLRKTLREKKESRNWYVVAGLSVASIGFTVFTGIEWLIVIPYSTVVLGTSAGSSISFAYNVLALFGGLVSVRLAVEVYRRRKAIRALFQ